MNLKLNHKEKRKVSIRPLFDSPTMMMMITTTTTTMMMMMIPGLIQAYLGFASVKMSNPCGLLVTQIFPLSTPSDRARQYFVLTRADGDYEARALKYNC